jgi:hypothetical protein
MRALTWFTISCNSSQRGPKAAGLDNMLINEVSHVNHQRCHAMAVVSSTRVSWQCLSLPGFTLGKLEWK